MKDNVEALYWSISSTSILGSVAKSFASVSGSSRFFPMPILSKFILSYLDNSLHYKILIPPYDPNTFILNRESPPDFKSSRRFLWVISFLASDAICYSSGP